MTLQTCLKRSVIALTIWIIFVIIVVRELKDYLIEDEYDTYTKTLKRFKRNLNSSVDRSEVWKQLRKRNHVLTYEDKLFAIQNVNIPPGNNGVPVILKERLPGTIEMLVRKGWQEYSFNEFVSDLIPVDRVLPDIRDKRCIINKSVDLPKVSVVIIFHNEAWSTLLRTVHSVLNRSPKNLLDKIILVDDFSTMCWLEPLLQRLAEDPKVIVSPVIDHINQNTFKYIPQTVGELFVGGFNWELKFIWRTPRKRVNITNVLFPIKTPTIAGGLFGIDTKFFRKLGYYDNNFDIWGGENLELSFKTWMCGGSLEIIPCSRVGHVFRETFPYEIPKESLGKNLMRLAQVWLDKYAKYFYQRSGIKNRYSGDITQQKKLRKKLQCKSFDWYLKNVYPELEVPNNVFSHGHIRNMLGFCLDSTISPMNPVANIHVIPCHHRGGNQFWLYTKDYQIKRDDKCLDYAFNVVIVMICQDWSKTQRWFFDNKTKHIFHNQTQECLTHSRYNNTDEIVLKTCSNESSQSWIMEEIA